MKKNILFFDLDGTIVDSAPGIIESVKYALLHFNIEEKSEEKLNLFIGPPLFDAFSKYYNMNKEDADLAVAKYRENYNGNGAIEKFTVYSGIEDCFKKAKEKGYIVCLATAKPKEFAERILNKADLAKYFDVINGASFDEKKRTKSAGIEDTIKSNNFNKEKIIMIGDRENDITGAKNNGISSLGVTYGFGDEKELKEAGCKNIVNSPDEILDYIEKKM